MEDLPLEIEEKIEQLPILPFEINEEFQELMFSDLFSDIFNFYKENYLPDTLKTKSEIYQRISLYLNLTGQGDKFTEETDKLLWRRPCPDIHTFLADKFYMGYNNSTLYPFWREKLEYMFRDSSPVRKAIFSGCIGCLTDDTVIVTLNGEKTIKELLNNFENEWVLSYNTSNNSWEPDKIIDVFYTGNRDIYEIELDNGEKIKCTSNHRFLTRKNKWVSIDNGLTSGLSMMPSHKEINRAADYKIKSITYIGKEDVYDITTEKNHNFALKAGIVAHNSGKSTVARKAFVYVLYRLLCLRYPRSVLNIDQDATIANVVIATTLKQVYEVNILPFIKLMETMPCFQRVMSQRSFENFNLEDPLCPIPFYFEKSSGTIHFPDNIILTSGSQPTHFTGMNVINSFCDEINDYGSVESTIALLNTLDNRFSSRFSNVDLVFQSVVSSARTTNSALGEYVRHLPQNDPSILKLNPMLWEVKPDPDFKGDGTTFPVMVGNGSIPSKIITDPGELKAIEESKYEPPAGCILINVPTIFRSKFELQLDQSIQDIAGITTDDDNSVFRDTTQLEDTRLNPEFVLEVNIRDNTNILDLLKQYDLFEMNLNNTWQFKRAPKADRYGHVDLAGGGSDGQCDAAVCILHKEYQYNEVTKLKDIIYVVDLLLAINAKNKVDIKAIQNFLIDLVVERDIPIHTITADQWQSLMFLQTLEASGCFSKVDKLSVDTKLEPYTNLATMLEQGQVKVGRCPKLKKELEALILDKGKVTRTTELKDLADALVGAVWNAQLNYTDVPIYEYTKPELKARVLTYTDYIDSSSELLCDL